MPWFDMFEDFCTLFADAFVLHESGNVQVVAQCVAFIFTFDAEMVTGHVHFLGVLLVFME
nr:hypothetical protein [Acinetobacter pittii]